MKLIVGESEECHRSDITDCNVKPYYLENYVFNFNPLMQSSSFSEDDQENGLELCALFPKRIEDDFIGEYKKIKEIMEQNGLRFCVVISREQKIRTDRVNTNQSFYLLQSEDNTLYGSKGFNFVYDIPPVFENTECIPLYCSENRENVTLLFTDPSAVLDHVPHLRQLNRAKSARK